MTFGRSGTGTGMDNSIPEIQEREGNGKNNIKAGGSTAGAQNVDWMDG